MRRRSWRRSSRLAIPSHTFLDRLSPTVTVVSAEERYLDGERERWPKEGARASITFTGATATEVELRFDTPDGRGSFGATLKRQRAAAQGSTR